MASQARSDIRQWIRQLEQLPQIIEDAVPEIQNSIDDLVTNQLAAGKTPDGSSWKANKDGSKPLVGIRKYVKITASSSGISVKLSEPATYHQNGGGNLPRRQLIPEGSLPASWSKAIENALQKAYNRKMNQ